MAGFLSHPTDLQTMIAWPPMRHRLLKPAPSMPGALPRHVLHVWKCLLASHLG